MNRNSTGSSRLRLPSREIDFRGWRVRGSSIAATAGVTAPGPGRRRGRESPRQRSAPRAGDVGEDALAKGLRLRCCRRRRLLRLPELRGRYRGHCAGRVVRASRSRTTRGRRRGAPVRVHRRAAQLATQGLTEKMRHVFSCRGDRLALLPSTRFFSKIATIPPFAGEAWTRTECALDTPCPF